MFNGTDSADDSLAGWMIMQNATAQTLIAWNAAPATPVCFYGSAPLSKVRARGRAPPRSRGSL